jgi:hypothetical protein
VMLGENSAALTRAVVADSSTSRSVLLDRARGTRRGRAVPERAGEELDLRTDDAVEERVEVRARNARSRR